MKIYDEIDLKNFEFWGDAEDTANHLTSSQFDTLDACLSDIYPDGISPRELNNLFCDSDYIYEIAGVYPKYFRIISDCGVEKYIKCNDKYDEDKLDNSGIENEEISIGEARYEVVEDMSYFDIVSFKNTHFFRITSPVKRNHLFITCEGNAVNNLKEAFKSCEITEMQEFEKIDGAFDWEDYDGDDEMIEDFINDND